MAAPVNTSTRRTWQGLTGRPWHACGAWRQAVPSSDKEFGKW